MAKKKDSKIVSLKALLDQTQKYLPPETSEVIGSAHDYIAKAYDGDVAHALRTAITVAELQLDQDCVTAAVLHEIPTRGCATTEEVSDRFGPSVAKLVEGAGKLAKVWWRDDIAQRKAEPDIVAHAENLRKMLVAVAEDIRVVFIKMACRLDKMKNLDSFDPERQMALCKDTMAIYAPVAHRLGIWGIKWQLEDLAFELLEPEKYQDLEKRIKQSRRKREQYIAFLIENIREKLTAAGIEAEVTGRPKHFYGISKKMEKYEAQGKEFSEIYDLSGIRIIVNNIPDCYSTLGVIHNHWRPLPHEFNDYIIQPKDGAYQSLHTTVMFMGTTPLEIQIRTRDMHRVAEYGIAAHWRYKEESKGDKSFEQRLAALRELLDIYKDVGGAEFMESIGSDVFSDLVLVYTPKGDILDLPTGSTPLDFAYHVHTDLGHRCTGAKVDRKIVPLNYHLQSGDTVEILTAKGDKGPSRDWLNPALGYLKTSHAREKVRQWFRKRERSENIQRGRELMDMELRRLGVSSSEEELAELFRRETVDDFLAAIGSGDISPQQIANKLITPAEKPIPEAPPKRKGSASGVQVMGMDDMLTHLAPCCSPLPGDEIVGYITRARGVSVHRKDCPNILNIDDKERLIEVNWETRDQFFSVPVKIDVLDRVGLLRDITAVIAGEGVNIASASTSNNHSGDTAIIFTLETRSLGQLSRLLSKLDGVRGVRGASRLK